MVFVTYWFASVPFRCFHGCESHEGTEDFGGRRTALSVLFRCFRPGFRCFERPKSPQCFFGAFFGAQICQGGIEHIFINLFLPFFSYISSLIRQFAKTKRHISITRKLHEKEKERYHNLTSSCNVYIIFFFNAHSLSSPVSIHKSSELING